MSLATTLPIAKARRSARRSPRKPTVPLPSVADGWSPECRRLIVRAYQDAFEWSLPGYTEVEAYTGPVPALEVSNLLMGSTSLAVEQPELTLAQMFDLIREAQRFLRLE